MAAASIGTAANYRCRDRFVADQTTLRGPRNGECSEAEYQKRLRADDMLARDGGSRKLSNCASFRGAERTRMNGYRKTSAAAQRFAERRQREDEAPRLEQEFPELVSLRLTIEEKSAGVAASVPKYSRHIMVATAPALFLIACGDRRCVDGGHDITTEVMSGLRAHQTHFEGEHACSGTLGSAACARIIGFIAEAEYRTG